MQLTVRLTRPPFVSYYIIAMVALQLGLGFYAIALNHLFYASFGPFYDSLAYFNDVAEMSAASRIKGSLATLADRIGHSTVFYPWLVFAPFAGRVSLDRSIGVWIQISAATIMQLALFAYFSFRARSYLFSLILSSVFLSLNAVFWFNGGISDFRMDLLQYFLFAAMMGLYFLARSNGSFAIWTVFGFSIGLLCLARATSVVYLLLIFGLIAPLDILERHGDQRRGTIVRWTLAATTAATIAGWFYLANMAHLYYYYFIWNLDANAKLPLAESVVHVRFAFSHIGTWLLIPLTLFTAARALPLFRSHGVRSFIHINWRALWFSIVPIGYLTFSGAGLNPFVSIVGTAGLLLFMLDPVTLPRDVKRRAFELVATALLVAGAGINVYRGIENHSSSELVSTWVPRREPLQQLTYAILSQVNPSGSRAYSFAVAHIGSLPADAVFNTLVFDGKLTPVRKSTVAYGNATLAPSFKGVGTLVEWNAIKGATDEEKLASVVEVVTSQSDFYIMTTDDSLLPASAYINQFVPELNRRILTKGAWDAVTQPIAISPTERVVLLRNRSRKW